MEGKYKLSSPPSLHAKQYLPVLQSAVMVRVPEHLCENDRFSVLSNMRDCLLRDHSCHYLAHLPQSSGLFAVDVALHAGLSSADEHDVPQGESSQRHRH